MFNIGDRVRIIGDALGDVGTVFDVDPDYLKVFFEGHGGFGDREAYLPQEILELDPTPNTC